MNPAPRKLNLDEWDERYEQLCRDGLREPGSSTKKISGWNNCNLIIRPLRSGFGIFC
jgi:hypothetical protein